MTRAKHPASKPRPALPKPAPRPGPIELTRPEDVRAEAARLYNDCRQSFGPLPKDSDARLLCTVLNLVRTAVADVELEERLCKVEDVLYARSRQPGAQRGAQGTAAAASGPVP